MTKILVEDPDERTQVPFLRGILTRTLQDAGVTFENAYAIATDIRVSLDDTASITTEDLRKKVLSYLREAKLPQAAQRYETLGITPTITVTDQEGQPTPYSGAEHQRTLETIGLDHDEARTAMIEIRKHLITRNVKEISSRHLAHLTYRYLRKSSNFGPSVAHRWLVWMDFVRSGRPLVFMIGGTAGCGKSTIATALANRLDIVRMQSTDMLREVMRTMIPKRLLPVLHTSSFTAGSALAYQDGIRQSGTSEELLIRGYRTQADLLSIAIEAAYERALRERVSLIIEGVHIHPALVENLPRRDDVVVVPIMLGILKRKQLQKRIKGRGTEVPGRRAQRYLEYFDHIWRLQSYLLSEADRANNPIIVNNDRDKVLREIMRVAIGSLATQFGSSAAKVFGNHE